MKLLFRVAPTGDIFQKKIDEHCNGMPNVFSIANDILIAEFVELGRDHDATLDKVLRICTQANLKPNKGKFFSGAPVSILQ